MVQGPGSADHSERPGSLSQAAILTQFAESTGFDTFSRAQLPGILAAHTQYGSFLSIDNLRMLSNMSREGTMTVHCFDGRRHMSFVEQGAGPLPTGIAESASQLRLSQHAVHGIGQ